MTTPTAHLDRLAGFLTAAGWVATARYDGTPVLLQVTSPDLRGLGESITVADGPDKTPWFFSSVGTPLAPVDDVAGTVGEIVEALGPFAEVARVFAAGGVPTQELMDRAADAAKRALGSP